MQELVQPATNEPGSRDKGRQGGAAEGPERDVPPNGTWKPRGSGQNARKCQVMLVAWDGQRY